MAKRSAPEVVTVTAYKAFDASWKCHNFQYEIGKSYTFDGNINLCSHGFHSCLVPFDCWSYYEGSRNFARVMVENPKGHDEAGSDSKIVSAKITIEASLSLRQWIKAQVETVLALCKSAKGAIVSSEKECAAATGYSGHAAATGYSGHAAATGKHSIAASLGYRGTAKGAAGSWLVLAQWNDNFELIAVKTAKVEGDIKPDTSYRLNASGDFEAVE